MITLIVIKKSFRVADISSSADALPRSGAQSISCKNHVYCGPRSPMNATPEEYHVILLDNGRSRLAKIHLRENLRCVAAILHQRLPHL
jgi:L-lactate utilization protein LutB